MYNELGYCRRILIRLSGPGFMIEILLVVTILTIEKQAIQINALAIRKFDEIILMRKVL